MAETSIVSEFNSTSTPLLANNTFTGTGELTVDYRQIGIIVKASHASVTNGLQIQFSTDNTNWDSSWNITVPADTEQFYFSPIKAKYFRIVYTNGSSGQTYFRLQCILHISQIATTISGDIVQISGQNITTSISGNIVQISGQTVIAKISGEVVNISGQPVTTSISGNIVQISGQCICTNISGQTVTISGNIGVIPDSDFLLEVSRGNISGMSMVDRFGNTTSVGNTISDIWEQGGLKIYPSVAATGTVKSTSANDTSAGTGARTVRIYGLDSSYNLINELISLNGTTNVTTANSYLRVYNMVVETAGSGETNAGDITITIGGNIQEFVETGEGRSQSTQYTIPAGKTGYAYDLYFVTTTAGAMECSFWCRELNSIFHMLREIYLFQDTFRDELDYAIKFTEKTDVVLRSKGPSGTNHKISGGYKLLLIDN